MKEILIFSTKTCAPCNQIKLILDRKGINYVVIDRDEGDNIKKMMKYTDSPVVPLVITDKGQMQGYNVSRLMELISE